MLLVLVPHVDHGGAAEDRFNHREQLLLHLDKPAPPAVHRKILRFACDVRHNLLLLASAVIAAGVGVHSVVALTCAVFGVLIYSLGLLLSERHPRLHRHLERHAK